MVGGCTGAADRVSATALLSWSSSTRWGWKAAFVWFLLPLRATVRAKSSAAAGLVSPMSMRPRVRGGGGDAFRCRDTMMATTTAAAIAAPPRAIPMIAPTDRLELPDETSCVVVGRS